MPGSESHHDGRKPKQTPSSLREITQKYWSLSYASDYAGLAILFALYAIMKTFDEPFEQMFLLSDPRIQHPHADPERVPPSMLFVYSLGVPAIATLLWNLALRPDLHKAHVTILGLLISLISTSFLTDVFKDAIGRPRPDLLARCSPEAGTPANVLVTISVCTEENHHLLNDGWRSFPSGHSSFAFAGLGWLALFFASQTHCLRPRASHLTVILCMAPLVGAAMIAASRLADYRHAVEDVIAGSLLGFGITYFNWRRYYPSLSADNCDEAYTPLVAGTTGGKAGFQRVRDEEEAYDTTEERFSIADGRDSIGRRDGR
ncbi:hypothetical protein B0A48_10612 [Cryoendolithus antarcticus]|uniref:Phosphatidic acid phosphatase type 2/haloperoxidase domain-containing protein n=1 Tax=Cryoendolithus antarcticus TaxID=1507870 RepID=A0A1V8SY23_9PEZI|nr:hypothetical protein B0A48_10612 [Cryoendolithus antarcticus]